MSRDITKAERGGFEPPNEVDPRYAISSRARSTAPAPLRGGVSLAWPIGRVLYSCQLRRWSSGISPPSASSPVTATSSPADHEVDMDPALVDARQLAGVLDDHLVGLPDRDVAGGVLVDQRVVEHGLERADAALAVDERDLAQPRGAVVVLAQAAQHLGTLLGIEADRAPVAELNPEAR